MIQVLLSSTSYDWLLPLLQKLQSDLCDEPFLQDNAEHREVGQISSSVILQIEYRSKFSGWKLKESSTCFALARPAMSSHRTLGRSSKTSARIVSLKPASPLSGFALADVAVVLGVLL